MHLSQITAAFAAYLLFQICSAQVSTPCDPLKGKCPREKGLATSSYAVDFTKSKSTPQNWTVANYENVTYNKNTGAGFTFKKRHDAPSMWTNFKIWFGRVEVVAQGAPGLGIISSMVLLSGDLDEIDWEIKGTGGNAIGTNYWGKGILDYTKNAYVGVSAPNSAFHTYVIDWSPTSLVWQIDGVVVRTVTAAEAGNQYPQSPMKLCLSLWDGGDPSNGAGTIQWAGGVTPIPPPKPYSFYVKSAKITNTNPAAEYEYTNMSGNASSIKIIKNAEAIHSSSSSMSSTGHRTSDMPSIASSLTIQAEGSKTCSETLKPAASNASNSTIVSSSSLHNSSHLTKCSTSTSHQYTGSSLPSSTHHSNTSLAMSTSSMVHTSMTTFSMTSSTMINGKPTQQVITRSSTIYRTSVITVCSKRLSHGSSITSAASSKSSTHPVVSSPVSHHSTTHASSLSSHSMTSIAAATSSAAPPMGPILLAAAKPTSSMAMSTGKRLVTSKGKHMATTSAIHTTTLLLTSTSTRTHSLYLWGTNGISMVAPSATGSLGTTTFSPSASMTSGIIFTAGTSAIQPSASSAVYFMVLVGTFLAHFFYL